tara:strand:- start:88798 stop:89073 length:276 start_codon:yes stop_codon:yes gene_type:complete
MSFLKSGYRRSLNDQKVKTKKHIKAFYQILNELDDVAKKICEKYPKEVTNGKVTDDTVNDFASEFTDRQLEKMERNILLAKLDILNGNKED